MLEAQRGHETVAAGSRPAHAKIEMYLRRLIAEGQGREAPLPTDRALGKQFGVSRMTVRQAYQRLVSSGTVVRYPSRGTFVTNRIVEDLEEMDRGNLQRWGEQGLEVEVRVLHYELRKATQAIADRFGVTPGAFVTYVERLRLTGGLPVTWDERYLVAEVHDLIREREIASISFTKLLPKCSIEVESTENLILARPAEEYEARHLGIQPGDTVIARETVLCGTGHRVVLSGVSIYPAGRVTFRHFAEA